jgi:chorismate mutase
MTHAEKKLKKLRKKIDRADRMLMKALGARLATVERIGRIKIAEGMPLLQKARWSEVMAERLKIAGRVGLEADFTHALYGLIHKEALRIQRDLPQIMASKTKKKKVSKK